MVRNLWVWRCRLIGGIIEGVSEIMGNKVTAFQQEVNIVWCPALHTVGCRYPGRVFWRTPVELGRNLAAELFNGALDGIMCVAPLGTWI